jgi:selenide, water dikinase
MDRALGAKNVVLLGIGHTHAHLIKQWAMDPIPDVNLIGITDHGVATYSGMLPGVLAGDYRAEQMEIDLVQLLSAAKVPWIQDSLVRVERNTRQLTFASGRQLRYDLLSVGVGSRPAELPIQPGPDGTPPIPVIGIKPMQTFLARLEHGIRSAASGLGTESSLSDGPAAAYDPGRPWQIDVVGGGLGSVEVVLCLRHFLARCGWTPRQYRLRLLSGSPEPPVGCLPSTRRRILRRMAQLDVIAMPGTKLESVQGNRLQLDNGQFLTSDLVVYLAAGLAAPATRLMNVPLDDRGCLLTDHCLQSIGDHQLWAGGDCGTIATQPLPKAGVFAVRQGPIMWENLKRWAQGEALQPYRPQADFLKLINLGGKQAIGEWRGVSFEGHWVWRWKDRIDSRFMTMYQTLPAVLARQMEPSPSESRAKVTGRGRATAAAKPKMRCLGCGSKIASESLRAVLRTISDSQSAEPFSVVDWRKMGDDVAIIPFGPTSLAGQTRHCGGLAVSVDAFPTPLTDPWLSGRLAVIHALSDLWASGVKPQTVLATVEIPFGDRQAQEDCLQQVMGGIVAELARCQVTLAGGHTLEGPRLSIALTVAGQTTTTDIPAPKQGLQAGDQLILTKGLGTGIALAALQQGLCSANLYQTILTSMLEDNAIGLELAKSFSVRALTDVTGFGLLGHLREMLAATACEIQLSVASLRAQVFPGVWELVNRGIRSTMHENNLSFLAGVRLDSPQGSQRLSPDQALAAVLLDPQTSGGLLLAVPTAEATDCLDYLGKNLRAPAAIIGSVHADREAQTNPSPPWCRLSEVGPVQPVSQEWKGVELT